MSTYDDASLILIPSGVKAGKVYSAKPVPRYGAELVVGGDMSNSANWNINSNWSVTGGLATANGSSSADINQANNLPNVGTTYRVTYTITAYTSGQFKVAYGGVSTPLKNTIGTHVDDIVAVSTDRVRLGGVSPFGSVDNLSIKEVIGSGDFTFTRASEATRLVDGVVTKVRTNSLLQSNDFDTTWATSGVSVTSGQAGYDGTNDAFKIVENTASGQHIIQQSVLSVGVVQCVSVYAKAAGQDWLMINQSGIRRTYYDLANGVMGSVQSDVIEATITAVGGGWYRCTYAAEMDYTGLRIGPTTGNNTNTYTGDGTSGVLVQDAQLEQGLVATPYIATTTVAVSEGPVANMPRLNSVAGGCSSLKLEPQRTNKITQSEYFQSGWVDNGNISYDFGYLAPDGTNSAYKITGNDNGYISFAGVLNNDTRSVYARTTSGTGTLQLLTYYGNTNNTFTITEEWQRFDISSVTTSTGEANFYLADFRGSSSLDEVILWGAQCEAGSYPTSYIPTYGTAATAAIEQAVLPTTSFDLTGDWSILLDFGNVYKTSTASEYILKLDTDTNDFYLYAAGTTTAGLNIYLHSQGGYVFGSSDNAAWGVDASKICVTYDSATGRLAYFINGSKYNEQTSALSFGNSASGSKFYAGGNNIVNIKKYLFFESALTDAEAITLTTL